MAVCSIGRISTFDAKYPLPPGAGSDAVHTNPEYCLAVTQLGSTDGRLCGIGFALTLGDGNRLVCEAIEMLSQQLLGSPIEDLMAKFGSVSQSLAEDPTLRWLGPQKGVVHLALASITNACFDLWAKSRGVPLWKLLLDLEPEAVVRLLDLSYLDEVLDANGAEAILREQQSTRSQRDAVLRIGYPGYDTSIGWMAYDDAKIRGLTQLAIDKGFNAFKLKVGSRDHNHDLRRAAMLRECVGDAGIVMYDANQQWTLPVARTMCAELAKLRPLWIEEPTHPDDVMAHVTLAREIAPVKIATGEHIPNRVVFKNFIQSGAMHYVQADCTRLAGVSEFLTVSLLAKKFNLPVVPHVGDMGQVHQHLVLFNHVAMGHDAQFLEYIPHLRKYFVHPAEVNGGFYRPPQDAGASSDLKELTARSSAKVSKIYV
jgi:L-fuconate dehydratase